MQKTNDVDLGPFYPLGDAAVDLLGDVELAQRDETLLAVLVGKHYDADGVRLLDGRVVGVDVLKERQERLQLRVRNADLEWRDTVLF